jgi:hypothetical protein
MFFKCAFRKYAFPFMNIEFLFSELELKII